MLIRKAHDLTYADVTPKSIYLDRRKFLRAMGIVGATAAAGKGLFDLALPPQNALAATKFSALAKSPFSTSEKENSYEDVTHYNNFYEFGTEKSDPAKNAKNFTTSNWMVSVEGEVAKPRKFTMDEILKLAPLEERIYRHRCVEAWTVDALLKGRKFEDFVHGELAGLGDFAFDGNHPVGSGKVLRILGGIALLSTEFVKIVVVRDVLVGVLFFGSAEGALGQGAEFRRGKRVLRRQRQIEQRSEEHTSELQSRPHLVCRLLLEKKNKIIMISVLIKDNSNSIRTYSC